MNDNLTQPHALVEANTQDGTQDNDNSNASHTITDTTANNTLNIPTEPPAPNSNTPPTASQADFLAIGIQTTAELGKYPPQDTPCSICLERLPSTASTEVICLASACGHFFHASCISTWFDSSQECRNTCPNCRCQLFDAPSQVYTRWLDTMGSRLHRMLVERDGMAHSGLDTSDYDRVLEVMLRVQRSRIHDRRATRWGSRPGRGLRVTGELQVQNTDGNVTSSRRLWLVREMDGLERDTERRRQMRRQVDEGDGDAVHSVHGSLVALSAALGEE
ncbi:hypothetical protein P280DRAFT_514945 [Massarina eburnea CBS 473.64]|uniref:RING-type domain-containing protein n=1 Tax=Massarina eburnea CBS 473.64 TaxID=1395130 RepID=A0A6A6S8S2_9PLEO|nr:hypothetical protein P280DRAFT_514945 [Massarina eburnea CBS 473.64]